MTEVKVSKAVIDSTNAMLDKNKGEMNAIEAEATVLVAEMKDHCDKDYTEPYNRANDSIRRSNLSKGKPEYLNTGHMVVAIWVPKKDRDGWPEVLCHEIRFCDYTRYNKNNRKQLHFKTGTSKDYAKMCSYAIPKYDEEDNKRSYHKSTKPFARKKFQKFSTQDWELGIFDQFVLTVGPTVRRYVGLVLRASQLRLERTECLRAFVRGAGGLSVSNAWNCSVDKLEAAIAAQYPEINLYL